MIDLPIDALAILHARMPGSIPFYRRLRYVGDEMDVQLSDFPAEEAALLQRLYAALQTLLPILRDHRDNPDQVIPQIRALYEQVQWAELNRSLRTLSKTYADDDPANSPQRINQVLHDLRGGAYTALAGFMQLIMLDRVEMISLNRMFFLCRDQLKIMRGALRGIDDVGYARDNTTNLHSTRLLLEKWQLGLHQVREQQAQIVVDGRYDGGIAERCLEFSALDRVIYNLINNAVRYSADDHVLFAFAPVLADDPPKDLRFAVANRISVEQREALERNFPTGVGTLFLGGFTTGGHGLGLRICADFVGNAYGLNSTEQGLAEGHFGALIEDDFFITWVHWPIAAD